MYKSRSKQLQIYLEDAIVFYPKSIFDASKHPGSRGNVSTQVWVVRLVEEPMVNEGSLSYRVPMVLAACPVREGATPHYAYCGLSAFQHFYLRQKLQKTLNLMQKAPTRRQNELKT